MEVLMLKHYVAAPFLCIFLGGICLSLSPGYNSNNTSRYPQNVKPGISDDSSGYQQSRNHQASEREKIVYMDERDQDIHRRANRMGDWNYRQNWRYDRKAFYKGDTQGEAYEEEHPEGTGGIGIDPDIEFLQMHKYYLEDAKREHERSNQLNNHHPYPNDQSKNHQGNQNNSFKSRYANNNSNSQGNSRNYINNNNNSRNSSDQRNQNKGSKTEYSNKNSYNQSHFKNNVIADNDTSNPSNYKDGANNSSKYDESIQNTDHNQNDHYSNQNRSPRYYYYYQ